MIIETNGKRIMTDPGSFTLDLQTKELKIDIILITHEHGDHIHVESLKKIIKNNPEILVITNKGVGKLLDKVGIKYQILKNKVPIKILEVELEAHDCKHEEIFEEMGQVQNTGYFINQRLFYPGDSFYNPDKPVEILALPVAGPWVRVKDFMKYVLDVKPEFCFPVHDGMLNSFNSAYYIPTIVLPKFGISFKILENKMEEEF